MFIKMSKYTVYLGGSIRGLSYEEAIKWREEASKRLSDVGIKSLSPMRNKGLINDEQKITNSYDNLKGYSSKDLFMRDKFDVIRSDIILINILNQKVVLIGSLFELAWGHLLNKYCIVVVNPNSVYAKHPFIKESASIMFDDLDEAIDYICASFGEENI